jgi:hypothetical protein
MPPVAQDRLPAGLLARFGGDERQRLVRALQFVAPLSTMSEAG